MTSRELEFSGTGRATDEGEPLAISDRLGAIKEHIAACEVECVQEGEVLVKRFRRERIDLHREEFANKKSLTSFFKPHRRGAWCPLNLFSRLHNGSLQIYWQLVHRDRRTKSVGYTHLSKNKRGGYDLRSLLSHAHEFERDLVAEYEEEAECQRQRWLHLMKIKHYQQRTAQIDDIETAHIRRLRAQLRGPMLPPRESTNWSEWFSPSIDAPTHYNEEP